MPFENLLAIISEPTDREQLNVLATKYPSLRRLAELGEQVEAVEPTLREMKLDLPAAVKRTAEWEQYRNDHWDPNTRKFRETVQVETERDQLQQALTDARAQIWELTARGETEMTTEEIQKIAEEVVKKLNVVDSATMEARLADVLKKDVPQQLNRMGAQFETVFASLTPRVVEHKEKFGETIDMSKIMQYMRDESARKGGIPISPDEAYEAVYRDKFQAASKAEQERLIAEAEKRGELKARQESAQSREGRGMPVASDGSVVVGALRRRVGERIAAKEKASPGSSKLGSGAATQEALREYREKQASVA